MLQVTTTLGGVACRSGLGHVDASALVLWKPADFAATCLIHKRVKDAIRLMIPPAVFLVPIQIHLGWAVLVFDLGTDSTTSLGTRGR